MSEYLELVEIYKRKKEREYEEKKDLFEAQIDLAYRVISQHASWVMAPHLNKNDRPSASDLYDPERIKKAKEEKIEEEKLKEKRKNKTKEEIENEFDDMVENLKNGFEM